MHKFIYKAPGLAPEVMQDEKINLATLQHYVEGMITAPNVPTLHEKGITVWANDEGLLEGMTPNVAEILDTVMGPWPLILVGPILLTSVDAEGNTIGLNEEQIEFAKAWAVAGGENLLKGLLLARTSR